MFFFTTITAVKICILTFYRKIFITRKFAIITYIITAFCIAWLLTGIFGNLFNCHPIEADWSVKYGTLSHCFPWGIFLFLHEMINALIDVAILACPVILVRRLQLSPRRKHQITGIFLLGGLYVRLDTRQATLP